MDLERNLLKIRYETQKAFAKNLLSYHEINSYRNSSKNLSRNPKSYKSTFSPGIPSAIPLYFSQGIYFSLDCRNFSNNHSNKLV